MGVALGRLPDAMPRMTRQPSDALLHVHCLAATSPTKWPVPYRAGGPFGIETSRQWPTYPRHPLHAPLNAPHVCARLCWHLLCGCHLHFYRSAVLHIHSTRPYIPSREYPVRRKARSIRPETRIGLWRTPGGTPSLHSLRTPILPCELMPIQQHHGQQLRHDTLIRHEQHVSRRQRVHLSNATA